MKTIVNGSFVGMEQGVCPICGGQHDTGTIMIHKGLKDVFPECGRPDPSCYHICEACEKMNKDGYVALIGVSNGGDTITPATAIRTSEYIWLKRHAAEQIIDTDLNEFPFCYIEPEAIEKIKAQVDEQLSRANGNEVG